jgi:GNAT superfamily N-acetyltransferase
MIETRPMTPDEFEAYREGAVRDYGEENVRSGDWAETEATDRSRAEFERLLPKGLDSPDHYFRVVLDPAGRRVGELWYFLDRTPPGGRVFLYWIGIQAEHRQHGYGSATLRWLEGETRRLSARKLSLHVFGHNRRAQVLYLREGFEITNLQMSKRLE